MRVCMKIPALGACLSNQKLPCIIYSLLWFPVVCTAICDQETYYSDTLLARNARIVTVLP